MFYGEQTVAAQTLCTIASQWCFKFNRFRNIHSSHYIHPIVTRHIVIISSGSIFSVLALLVSLILAPSRCKVVAISETLPSFHNYCRKFHLDPADKFLIPSPVIFETFSPWFWVWCIYKRHCYCGKGKDFSSVNWKRRGTPKVYSEWSRIRVWKWNCIWWKIWQKYEINSLFIS